ncbi:hypothetical protein [Amycolatopsis sp. NPDC098790]|uniref:hypothetical protein n=1 Tax=Amycolatopsis sp. NPDC098790 TaxID=3363939 RepID=UPI00381A4435
MLIEDGWKPGVWIDGDHSRSATVGDVFGTFAHLVYEDLRTARTAGRIAANVEITISASNITPLWGSEPPVWLLHIRFTGVVDSQSATACDEVATETLSVLDKHGRDQLPLDMFDRYSGRLFFLDGKGNPVHSRIHGLSVPSAGI